MRHKYSNVAMIHSDSLIVKLKMMDDVSVPHDTPLSFIYSGIMYRGANVNFRASILKVINSGYIFDEEFRCIKNSKL